MVEEVVDLLLGYMKLRVKGLGGFIVVSKIGDWVVKWIFIFMFWVVVKDGKLYFGVDFDDIVIMDLF